MNWIKKQIVEWALRQQDRKHINVQRGQQIQEPIPEDSYRRQSDTMFDGVEQMRFTIFNVDNGTLVRMDTFRPEDQYTVRSGGPRRPPVYIVKDGETVQDVIVRQLGVAALERV